MNLEILLMLALLAASLILFAMERVAIEVTAMIVLGVLVGTGVLTVDEALLGLSNKAVVTIGALFVLSHGLVRTGVLEYATEFLAQKARGRKWAGIAVLLLMAALLSGFLNNTAVVAIFIPLALGLCASLEVSPSKVLIPLSYASMLGGTLTLIGTSTNLLVSAIVEQNGAPPLRMFEFTQLGVVFLMLGMLYVLGSASRLLPGRAEPGEPLTRKYDMKEYLTELRVRSKSNLVGKSCEEAQLGKLYGITLLAIVRKGSRIVDDVGRIPLQVGDTLIVEGDVADFMRLREEAGLALLPDVKLTDRELSQEGQVTVEALVPPTSNLVGKTLKELNFQQRFNAFVLAIRRRGETLHSKVGLTPLQVADDLLMVVRESQLGRLRSSENLIVLSEHELSFQVRFLWWAPAVLIPVVVLLAATGTLEILEGALLASVLLLALGVVRVREAYRAIDWSVLLLIAAFVPVGQAMVKTGTAGFIASSILSVSDYFPGAWRAWIALSLIYLTTSLLTQMVANNAAAIIVTPISIAMAASLGADPRPFVIAICFAASGEFMTPFGYQTNMMVYGPGAYRFLDYTRFGFPLNLSFWLLASLLIPLFWPFSGG